MPYSDAGNQSLLAMGFPERFWNRLGATRVQRSICGPTVGAGVKMTLGTTKCLDPMEIRHSKLIILWGTNTKLTNRHLWPTIEEARVAGAQIVVIDPIRTVTADAGDWFIQPRPGTDVALMLAVMHVLIRDGLTDEQWIADHTLGFDELAMHVDEWTPERAAATCGVEAADIERLAQLYGTIRPAVIRTLIGAEHHENGAMFFRTLACLPALVGAWKDRGGGLARSIGVWTGSLIDDAAMERPDLLGIREPRWVNMSRLGEILTETTNPPIRALMVWGCNPLVIAPNSEKIRAGVLRDDLFTVVHEQFITDTARYADIVLPATTQLEATDVVAPWGHLWLSWNNAAIEPCGEAVSNSEVFRRLARAMGYTEPALFDDDMTAIRAAMPGVDVDELRRVGFVRAPYPDRWSSVRRRGVPDPQREGRVRQRDTGRDGPTRTPDLRAADRGSWHGDGSALSAATDDAEAPQPIPQQRIFEPARPRRTRVRTLRRAVRRRRRVAWHHRRPARSGVQRPGLGGSAGADHRTRAHRASSRSRGVGGTSIIPTRWSPTHSPTTP